MDITIKTCLSPRKQKKMNNMLPSHSKVGNFGNVLVHDMRLPICDCRLATGYLRFAMDLSPFRQNFEKKIEIGKKYHHSLKEHPTFTKIAKFGCEML